MPIISVIQTHLSRHFHLAVDFLGLRRGGSWSQPVNQARNLDEQFGQSKRVIELAVGKKTTIGDVAAGEFQLQAPVAIDPERLQFRFTHRVRHDRAPSIAAMY